MYESELVVTLPKEVEITIGWDLISKFLIAVPLGGGF